MNFLLIPAASGTLTIRVDVQLEASNHSDIESAISGTSIGGVHLEVVGQAKINKKILKAWLERYFDKDDLIELCWNLNIPFDHLEGSTLPKLARNLIDYLERRDRIEEFLIACREARPTVYDALMA